MDGKKRWALLGALVLGVSLVVYALFFMDDDEDLIIERLGQLASAVEIKKGPQNPVFRAAHLKDEFRQIFTPSVEIEIPEINRGDGATRDELANYATAATMRFETGSVSLDSMQITIAPSKVTAEVQTNATLIATAHGNAPRRDVREVRFELVKTDGEWRISRLEASESTGGSQLF